MLLRSEKIRLRSWSEHAIGTLGIIVGLSSVSVSSLLSTSLALAAAESNDSVNSSGTKDTGSLKGIFTPGEKDKTAPVYIKSDNLTLDSKSRVFTYQGAVEITRGDMKITSDVVIGRYDENNELQTVVCQDNVVVTRGEDLRAIANKAVYRVAAGTITLTEAPELMRGGNVLAADKITVFVDEDRSEAEGNVRVKVINTEEGKEGSGKNPFALDSEPETKASDAETTTAAPPQ
ncbi:MAG: lipopolysaccharide transport periplasmic protein LptA [Bdellovibrionales bacterium]|nr:lipopolysaccharide transport periplasmic protein LptA [Bdellovibrionales bacterium]